MPPSTTAVEALVFDLMHKPITKEIVTKVLTHDLLTAEAAEKAVDVLYRKEALDNENYNLYLSFYARHGDVDKVMEGIDKANEIYKIPQPKDKWHRSLARAYGATGQATPAMRHMKLARENDPDTCDIRSNDALISSILARAREIFEGLVNYKRQKRERERSANTEFMTTETERRTKELMTIAIEAAQEVRKSGGVLNERTHQYLITTLHHSRMYAEALDMVMWATQVGFPTDRAAVIDAQFFLLASQSKLDEALYMLKQIPHKKFAHYSALIACCGDKGDMATWQHICREVRLFSKQMRASVFGKLIDIMGKKGAVAEMEDLFKELKVFHGTAISHITYSSMISIYVNLGNMTRAHQLFLEMRRHHVEPNEITYSCLLRGRLMRDEFYACDYLLAKAQDAGITNLGVNLIEPMLPYWADNTGAMKRTVYWLKHGTQVLRPGQPRNSLFNRFLDELAQRGDMNSSVELTHEMRALELPLCAHSYTALFRAAAHAKLDGAYPVLRDGIEKDDVEITHALRIAMLRYAVAMDDVELSEALVQEIHKAIKNPSIQGDMDNDSKNELLKLIKGVNDLRDRSKNKNTNTNTNTENNENNENNNNNAHNDNTIDTTNNATDKKKTTKTSKDSLNKKNKHP